MNEPMIALLGWVTIARKQAYQVSSLIDMGYRVAVFTNDNFGDSSQWLQPLGSGVELHRVRDGFFARLFQVVRFFSTHPTCKAAIIAPVGRFSIFYLLLCKLFGVKTICVEWGDIHEISELGRMIQSNMKMCYRFSDMVWYKEPHMEPLLRQFRARNIYFLPNVVDWDRRLPVSPDAKDLDFVWVNRFCNRRNPDWMAHALKALAAERPVKAAMMGLLDGSRCDRFTLGMQERVKAAAPQGTELQGFGDPYPLYERARFFVLAADAVFGNNSMLEAMSCGVVPIVTRAPGVERVVIDGVNGIVTEASQEGLLAGMKAALEMDGEQWSWLSHNARAKIESDFQVSAWASKMREMLDRVLQPRTTEKGVA